MKVKVLHMWTAGVWMDIDDVSENFQSHSKTEGALAGCLVLIWANTSWLFIGALREIRSRASTSGCKICGSLSSLPNSLPEHYRGFGWGLRPSWDVYSLYGGISSQTRCPQGYEFRTVMLYDQLWIYTRAICFQTIMHNFPASNINNYFMYANVSFGLLVCKTWRPEYGCLQALNMYTTSQTLLYCIPLLKGLALGKLICFALLCFVCTALLVLVSMSTWLSCTMCSFNSITLGVWAFPYWFVL